MKRRPGFQRRNKGDGRQRDERCADDEALPGIGNDPGGKIWGPFEEANRRMAREQRTQARRERAPQHPRRDNLAAAPYPRIALDAQAIGERMHGRAGIEPVGRNEISRCTVGLLKLDGEVPGGAAQQRDCKRLVDDQPSRVDTRCEPKPEFGRQSAVKGALAHQSRGKQFGLKAAAIAAGEPNEPARLFEGDGQATQERKPVQQFGKQVAGGVLAGVGLPPGCSEDRCRRVRLRRVGDMPQTCKGRRLSQSHGEARPESLRDTLRPPPLCFHQINCYFIILYQRHSPQ